MIEADVEDIRDVLGPYATGWTDAQLASDAILLPARRILLELCPTIDQLDDSASIRSAEIALASLAGATLILSSPRYTSSRLGDMQVSFTTGSTNDRANVLMAQARDMVATVCPVPRVRQRAVIFRVAPGRRGQ